MNIIKKIKDLGYIVSFKNNQTTIYEPYKSDIDGKKFLKEIAHSSASKNIEFLERIFKDLTSRNFN